MSKKAVILLADGFEEIEAITCIDLLRRAQIDVKAISVTDERIVCGSRKIKVETDMNLQELKDLPDAVILPGGMPAAENLSKSEKVLNLIKRCNDQKKIIAAICAAPAVVLLKTDILKGKKATCYPSFKEKLKSKAIFVDKKVVVDDNIITSQGPGTALYFALKIIKNLRGEKIAKTVAQKTLIEYKDY
jgi:4-methyl-5(b-hydroxyethyl)-thiazole monophosphate biosynthesis